MYTVGCLIAAAIAGVLVGGGLVSLLVKRRHEDEALEWEAERARLARAAERAGGASREDRATPATTSID
jgi:hypothetical protein